jgi:excisionase family DNA binding protein
MAPLTIQCQHLSKGLYEMSTERKTMTIEDAAQVLGISRNSAYTAAKRGEIPTIKIGRLLLVPTAALDRLVAGEQARAAA